MVKGLGERFLKEHVALRCKPSTQGEYKRSVELFINPKIGTSKVTDIERCDIAELHHSLSHIPYQANRTLGVLSKMFNLAEVWGLRPDGSNPCLHIKKYAEQKRARFLSPEEFATLGKILRRVESDGSETLSAVNAIRLLILTGCRLSEIMTLKWEYVDTKAHELHLPDSKTGAKVIHFGQTVANILDNIKKLEDNPWVILGKKGGDRLTKPKHPWTNGQVERMNRTIKEATVKRYHYDGHEQLRNHLTDFINAYNFGRRLKTLKGLTPYEFIIKIWTKEPERFNVNPLHYMLGPNT